MKVQIGWLTEDLIKTGPLTAVTGIALDSKTVHFMAAAPTKQVVDEVLSAAGSVMQMTLNERPELNDHAPPSPEGHYVYGYFENSDQPDWDKCFYIGKGVNRRWTDHVRNRTRSGAQDARTEKESRIDAWIAEKMDRSNHGAADFVRLAENSLVRILDRWDGPNAEACAFAAEYALISGFRGAYQLANETSGNGRSGELRILVREAGLNRATDAHSQVWDEAVHTFFRNPDAPILKSRIRPNLILLANLPNLTWLDEALRVVGLIPAQKGRTQKRPLAGVPAHFGIEGASDISISYSPLDNRPFRIQLKLSHKDAAAVINVRPRQDTAEGKRAFFSFMETVRPNGVALATLYGGNSPIRNANNNPFFKPFATNGNGRADTFFPVRPEAGPMLTSPDWAAATPIPLTLLTALTLFLDTFADQP